MNYRVHLSPIFGTPEPHQQHLDLPLRERWEDLAAKWDEAEVFRSWLVYDSDAEAKYAQRRVNWNMLLGLGLAFSVSVSFWIGLGLVIANRWK
jgi:hypothetical protein